MAAPSANAKFWADAHLIAQTVRREANTAAVLATGGSDGCAQCKTMTFAERANRGHLDCAEALAATKGAQRTASNLGEVWIEISRTMEDPRFGQWIRATDNSR